MVARVSGLCFVVDYDWIVLLFVLGFWCVLLLRGVVLVLLCGVGAVAVLWLGGLQLCVGWCGVTF